MMTTVSRRDFHKATVVTGDVQVLEAYFAQPHVAAEVAQVNSYFQGRTPSINLFDEGPEDPWYFASRSQAPWQVPGGGAIAHQDFVFTTALANGLIEVIEWFYAPARAVSLGATLAALLPFTGALAADESLIGVVEMLLTCQVFATRFDDVQKQQLLNDLLNVAVERNHIDVMDLLVAHGADVNPHSDQARDHPLASCAAMGNEDGIAMLIEHGALVVGASLLIHSSYLGNIESACELLRSGVDWGNHAERHNPLHAAAEDGHADLVRIYLEEGFADVDARNTRGETALMMATWQASAEQGAAGPDAAEAVARELVNHRAYVSLTDLGGNTALHHAVGTEYTRVVAMLLESGVDPNERNNRGERALDSLPLAHLDDDDHSYVLAQVELLVTFGTDLNARGHDGYCALDRLQVTNAGQTLLWRLASDCHFRPKQLDCAVIHDKAPSTDR